MDKTILVEDDVSAGANLVGALEATGLPIGVAAWLKLDQAPFWQLYITSPDVQTYGPTTVIIFIDKVINGINSNLSMRNLEIGNTSNHFANYISDELRLSKLAPRGVKLFHLALGGTAVAEALVYKASKRARPSKLAPKADHSALERARSLAA